jgi:hypothetical protein
MVKKTICLWILLTAGHAGFAQGDVKGLFDEFSNLEGVDRIRIGTISMKFANFFTETMGIEKVEILSFEACADEVKERFNQAVGKLKDKKFDALISANENGKNVRVLLRIENELIRELVVLSSHDSPAMIRIKGKIKRSDIGKVVDQHSK